MKPSTNVVMDFLRCSVMTPMEYETRAMVTTMTALIMVGFKPKLLFRFY
jgi:hypothetical protein